MELPARRIKGPIERLPALPRRGARRVSMLYRRTFLGAALAIASGVARAQEARRRPKIGVLWHAASVEEEGKYYAALVESLRSLGYEHGRTAEIEHRFPAEQKE